MAGEVDVPRVAVNDIDATDVGGDVEVDGHGPQRGPVGLTAGEPVPGRMRVDGRVRADGPRLTEAVHLDVKEPRQFASEVFDVHAGAAVHLRRVLPGEQCGLHRPSMTRRLGSLLGQ